MDKKNPFYTIVENRPEEPLLLARIREVAGKLSGWLLIAVMLLLVISSYLQEKENAGMTKTGATCPYCHQIKV